MDNQSIRDLLSELPLSIIHTILELVPIREAVRTSILSRQWRYIWASLPQLVFDDECVNGTGLRDFITQALLLHKGPIHKFKLSASYLPSSYCIHQWLLFLSRNHDIRTFILNIGSYDEDWCLVNSSLYSCQNLIHLELSHCELRPPPPTFKGFLCLRCLVLRQVYTSSDEIESLVANSPLLEELTLEDSGSLELRIRAPNLKYFYLRGGYNEIGFHIFADGHQHPQKNSSVCNYAKFFGGCTNLEELSGDASFIKSLSIGVESCHHSLVFPRLRVIELCQLSFRDIKEIMVVVRLIMGAPNLHKLTILGVGIPQFEPELPSTSLWDSECAPNVTLERLKVIKMAEIRGVFHEMKLIKFLLRSSPVLETMIFKPYGYLNDKEVLNLTVELLRYRRASTNAEILFNNK